MRRFGWVIVGAGLTVTPPARAVRPFVTDDARVVGRHQAQVETWLRLDRDSLQHWIVPAFGPIAPLEVTLGALHGAPRTNARYTLSGPLVQAKLLLRPAEAGHGPGFAIVGGTMLPFGIGAFVSPVNAFAYLAGTQVFGDDAVLVHGNLGAAGARSEAPADATAQEAERHARVRLTWGLATQLHLWGPANLALEVFSGDPYAEVAGGACQAGLRFIVSEVVQLDASGGVGLWGVPRMPGWVSIGLRIVSRRLFEG